MDHQPSPDSLIFSLLCYRHATANHPMRTAEVARLSGLDRPTFEAALERLIKQGLVSRHATLGAATSVGLTEFGQSLC